MHSKLVQAFRRWAKGRKQVTLCIPLNPVPASRPRVSKWGVHYAKTYAEWKRQARLHLPNHEPVFPTGPLAVLSIFHVQPARTTKRDYPRGDNDNFVKAAWDAVTKSGGTWGDDDQVVVSMEVKRYITEKEEAHTEILIVEL